MTGKSATFDRTIGLGDRAFAHIRSHRTAASPRFYEFWFAVVGGEHAGLSRAVNELLANRGTISNEEIEELYDRHLNPVRAVAATEKAAAELASEMIEVDGAIGKTREGLTVYRKLLQKASLDIRHGVEPDNLPKLLNELLRHTTDTERLNGHLSDRLSQAIDEMNGLRTRLDSIRIESNTDAVTTLLNRQAFNDTLAAALAHSQKSGESFALLMIDIDHFKNVNDSYGHVTGDQVLRLVAQTVKHMVKGQDTCARYGGEEFAVILPNTRLDGAVIVAEQIRKAVMSRELIRRSTGENLGRVTVSLGVGSVQPGDAATAIVERADKALYLSKRGGRNKVSTELDLPDAVLARIA